MSRSRNILLIGFLFLAACGRASESVVLTLAPYLGGSPKPAVDLSRELIKSTESISQTMAFNPSLPSCVHKNLFAAVKLGGQAATNDPTNFKIFPVALRSEISTAANPLSNSNIVSWLNNNSVIEAPIQIPVEAGQTVEVGIFGNVQKPIDGNSSEPFGQSVTAGADGICDAYSAASLGASSFSLVGRTEVTATANRTVPLPVFVVPNAPTPDFSQPNTANATAGDFVCGNNADRNTCSYRDYIRIINNSTSQINLIAVDFLFSSNRPEGIRQILSQGSGPYYVPRIYPMKLTYTPVSSPGVFVSQIITGPTVATGISVGGAMISFLDVGN